MSLGSSSTMNDSATRTVSQKTRKKCETITQYCSKKVGEFIEALESYSKADWPQLKKDLLKFYNNDRSSKRYRQKDIVAYTEETKLKKIKDLSTWICTRICTDWRVAEI
jgi:hypothetical protein